MSVMPPAGRDDCPECHGVGWTMPDPGGSLKDMPPMVPAYACTRCNPPVATAFNEERER